MINTFISCKSATSITSEYWIFQSTFRKEQKTLGCGLRSVLVSWHSPQELLIITEKITVFEIVATLFHSKERDFYSGWSNKNDGFFFS